MTDKIGIFKAGHLTFITVRGNSFNGTWCRAEASTFSATHYRLKCFSGRPKDKVAPAALSKWTT